MSDKKEFSLVTIGIKDGVSIATCNSMSDDIKAKMGEFLELPRYNFVVTADSLDDAKTTMAELNKIKSSVKTYAKELIEAESTEIKAFDDLFKDFIVDIDSKRNEIGEGREKFESIEKEKHLKALMVLLKTRYEEEEIRETFQNFDLLKGMLSISGFNSDGKTVKKASRDKVEAIVSDAKGKQAIEDADKLKEEARIREEAQKLIDEARENDIDRAHARGNVQQQQQQQPQQQPQNNDAVDHHFPSSEPVDMPTTMPEPTQGNSVYSVTIQYFFEAKSGIPTEAIAGKVDRVMKDAEFESELNITVTEG